MGWIIAYECHDYSIRMSLPLTACCTRTCTHMHYTHTHAPLTHTQEIDPPDKLEEKISLLCEMLTSLQHVVVHTGAGISTAAGAIKWSGNESSCKWYKLFVSVGIPDFRGPKGVWTLEKQGRKVETDVTFEDAKPTLAHMALVGLVRAGVVKYVISQNVDGLHLKSGLPR